MPDSPPSAPGQRPIMVFDGGCGICCAAVERWRAATGSQIEYSSYQEVAAQFPQIGEQAFRRAVHFIGADGNVSRGAAAVFRAMALCGRKRWLWWLYQTAPPFAWTAEFVYRLYAANRKPLAIVRRVWYGKDLQLSTYHIASALFLRLLGVVYLISFISLWTQIDGLIGDHGLLPVENYLETIDQYFSQTVPPSSPVWNLPTLAWISPHDVFLNWLCGAGAVLSVMLIFGLLPMPALVMLWATYLSLFHAGQEFLSFQWDNLLLETGFVAIFLAPFAWRSKLFADRHPPRIAIWLAWWVLFRLMFESGAVKLSWNTWALGLDGLPVPNTWHLLTALDFHYWTQPLPMWISWYAAKLPQWFQKLSVVFVLVVELGTPWLIFGPRLLKYIASGAITLLMLLIAATGNYNFFNLLTIVLAVLLLDDKAWPQFLRGRIRGSDWPVLASPMRWRTFLLVPFAVFALIVGGSQVREAISPAKHRESSLAADLKIAQFCLVNEYGLFRQMTETRPEIIIEGAMFGTDWKPYEFKWKPGEVSRPPGFNTPHQPRLDWQMWFEALKLERIKAVTGNIDLRYASPWFQSLLMKLLKGEPKVVQLLAANPFPDGPPRFIRVQLYEYRFTDAQERRKTGDWWDRKQIWVGPILSTTQ